MITYIPFLFSARIVQTSRMFVLSRDPRILASLESSYLSVLSVYFDRGDADSELLNSQKIEAWKSWAAKEIMKRAVLGHYILDGQYVSEQKPYPGLSQGK